MINFWVDCSTITFYIPNHELFEDGSIRLSRVVWFEDRYDWYNVEIGMDFLNKGFKI